MITPALTNMIHREPFFANLVMNMTRNYTTDIPTVGVNVTETVNLHINPYFWGSLTLDEQIAVLKHEVYHVLNNHIGRFKELEPHMFENKEMSILDKIKHMMEFKTLNIAADAAINQYIPGIPKKMKFFDKEGNAILEPATIQDKQGNEIPNPNAGKPVTGEPVTLDAIRKLVPKADAKSTMEYYYAILQQQKQKNAKNGGQGQSGDGDSIEGMCSIDDHSIWQQGEQNEEYVKEKLKKIVNDAAEKTMASRSAGNIPSEVQILIEALNHQPKDWKQDLQRFVSKTSEIVVESSRKARDRRYGIIYPGKRVYPKLTLAVAADTSGSCFDAETVGQFAAEISRIAKNDVCVKVITFDAQVQQVFDYDQKTFNNIKFKGGGGTLFQPVFDKGSELEIDGMIMLTDGCAFDNYKKPKNYPVMFALLKGTEQYLKADFGYKTIIEIKKKYKTA